MEEIMSRVTFLLLLFVSQTNGYAYCDGTVCEGATAYCCDASTGKVCCWSSHVYELWWFWVIWVVLFFLILACVSAFWRRRRAQYRYVVMANSEYPTYGTVVHTSNSTTQSVNMPPHYMPPTASARPPGYTVSEKPPAYSS